MAQCYLSIGLLTFTLDLREKDRLSYKLSLGVCLDCLMRYGGLFDPEEREGPWTFRVMIRDDRLELCLDWRLVFPEYHDN